MIERILQIIRNKNLTPSQFADEIGIQRSGMSHLISGRNNPSLEFVMKVLKRYPDIRPEWLLYGNVEANPPSTEATDNQPGKDNETDRIKLNTPSTLFDQPELADIKPESKPPRSLKREKTGRKIEKIIVFYDDRTFREYDPEQ